MHMADALISPAAGGVMLAASVGASIYAAYKLKNDDFCDKKVPVMAVAGAFVFAAQMINFTIPGTGSSGHIGGGILLAGLLGGPAAFFSIASVLLIQCLFFADGGLLALGCNVFNLGVFPCFIVYPLVFKPLMGKGATTGRLLAASTISAVAGLQFGAFAVVLETLASGITALPFETFALLMQPIHLAIGVVEGIATGAVLAFVHRTRPEIVATSLTGERVPGDVSVRGAVTALAAGALLLGALFSNFASSNPDGLEWSMEKVAGTAELEANGALYGAAASIQETTAILPDYSFAPGSPAALAPAGTSVAGVVGALLTFTVAGALAWTIRVTKRRAEAKARA